MIWKSLIIVLSLLFLYFWLKQMKPYSEYLQTLYSGFDVKQIHSSELNQTKQKFIFDTRSEKEFKVSHIKNAVFIDQDVDVILRNKEIAITDTIIVYCSVGYRSCKVAEELSKLGYTEVYNLYGGIFKWVNDSNKVYSGNKETNRLHTYSKKWGKYVSNSLIKKVSD